MKFAGAIYINNIMEHWEEPYFGADRVAYPQGKRSPGGSGNEFLTIFFEIQ